MGFFQIGFTEVVQCRPTPLQVALPGGIIAGMCLKACKRRKNGKERRRFSVVESRRLTGSKVLHLGEINDSRQVVPAEYSVRPDSEGLPVRQEFDCRNVSAR